MNLFENTEKGRGCLGVGFRFVKVSAYRNVIYIYIFFDRLLFIHQN
jgi:hypothetical protein